MSGQIFVVAFAVSLTLAPVTAAADAPDAPDARTILSRARAAAGGDRWADVRSLVLRGRAVFWGKTGAVPTSSPDRYVMHRMFDPTRMAAHGAEGKVRIDISNKGKRLFVVGYDGTTSWNEKGVIPKAEADAFWASNFGFGIIRHALSPGFSSERLADSNVDGHSVYIVRLTDPAGTVTLFGIDTKSYAVRMAGFATPRGWHVRTYDRFFRPPGARWWLQAGRVTLTYNGVKQNEIHWTSVEVNPRIDDGVFAPPPQTPGQD